MKFTTIEEVLNIPQLDIFISYQEYPYLMTRFNQHEIKEFQEDYLTKGKLIEERTFREKPREEFGDRELTALIAEIGTRMMLNHKQKFNPDKFMLYLGGLAGRYLTALEQAENGKHKGRDEICFRNGDIIVINENDILFHNTDGDVNQLKQKLAEGILITNNQLQNNKAKRLTISGTYPGRGSQPQSEEVLFSTDKIEALAKSKTVISNLPLSKFNYYIKQGLMKKWDVVRYVEKGILSKDDAVQLMLNGVFSQEEILKNVFKTTNLLKVVDTKQISFNSKLLLYSSNRIDIKTLEQAVQANDEEDRTLSKDDLKMLAKYYIPQKNRINKISELLTHNVLDYDQSMQFLETLVEENVITDQDKEYLEEVMEDFKTQELLNSIPNGGFGGGHGPGTPGERRGVTIDPIVRAQYLQSIGNVKQVFINGETLIRDESGGEKKTKNSLDGYELIIIPDKKIAVLEKFYETTRDRDGNIVYKKDENGRLIPAIENATYIMPIGMAKDFAEKKNKQQLRSSPYVRRAPHTMNWVAIVEGKMMEINPVAQFEVGNTEKWAIEVANNYKKNLDAR